MLTPCGALICVTEDLNERLYRTLALIVSRSRTFAESIRAGCLFWLLMGMSLQWLTAIILIRGIVETNPFFITGIRRNNNGFWK